MSMAWRLAAFLTRFCSSLSLSAGETILNLKVLWSGSSSGMPTGDLDFFLPFLVLVAVGDTCCLALGGLVIGAPSGFGGFVTFTGGEVSLSVKIRIIVYYAEFDF